MDGAGGSADWHCKRMESRKRDRFVATSSPRVSPDFAFTRNKGSGDNGLCAGFLRMRNDVMTPEARLGIGIFGEGSGNA